MKIRAYTLFTPSHKDFLYNYLLKSFKYSSDIELTVIFKDQLCKTAESRSEGWHDTMYYKVNCFYDKLKECKEDSEYFMFIDPDIMIYKDFYSDLVTRMAKGYDVLFQNDGPGGANTGFFVARNNSKTRAFFNTVRGNLQNFVEEQVATNFLLRNLQQYPSIQIKWGMLPSEYWTFGEIAGQFNPQTNKLKGHWDGVDETFTIPENIFIHHGNWTLKKDDKYKILDIVERRINGN
jgi:hypothetical protein